MTTTASVDLTIRSIETGSSPGSTCSSDLATAPWEIDTRAPGYGPGASQADVLPLGSPGRCGNE